MVSAAQAVQYRPGHAAGIPIPKAGAASRYLGLIMFLLFFIPPRYSVGPSGLRLGSTGVLGVLAALAWVCAFLLGRRGAAASFNPVRSALLVLVGGLVLAAASAYGRPLSQVEASGTIRSLVLYTSYLGLALATCDTIRSERDLRGVIDATVAGATFCALVALGQKLFHLNYNYLWQQVPFLSTADTDSQLQTLLSGRAIGTSNHPIELSVVTAAVAGLAIVQSRFAATENSRLLHRVAAVILVAGSLIAVSRSGFIVLVIVALISLVGQSRRTVINSVAVGVVALILVQVFSHGTLSTLRYQLSNAGSDNSSKGRTSDYVPVFGLLHGHLTTGIGLGTFQPRLYRFLDNAWLGLLVAGGIILVTVFAVMLLTTLYAAGELSRRGSTPYRRALARSAGASIFGLAVAAYFFDELSYPQATGVLFLLLGTVGCLWRLEAVRNTESPPAWV